MDQLNRMTVTGPRDLMAYLKARLAMAARQGDGGGPASKDPGTAMARGMEFAFGEALKATEAMIRRADELRARRKARNVRIVDRDE